MGKAVGFARFHPRVRILVSPGLFTGCRSQVDAHGHPEIRAIRYARILGLITHCGGSLTSLH